MLLVEEPILHRERGCSRACFTLQMVMERSVGYFAVQSPQTEMKSPMVPLGPCPYTQNWAELPVGDGSRASAHLLASSGRKCDM